jgi:hypothetical protein
MNKFPSKLPDDAQDYVGFSIYGVDDTGTHVFFGFSLKDEKRAIYVANYNKLGATINYLQRIANEAHQKRTSLDRTAAEMEVRQSPSNPAMQATLEPDVAGKTAAFRCTKQDGTEIEAQLSLDMVQTLLDRLPETIAEMQRRRAASRH